MPAVTVNGRSISRGGGVRVSHVRRLKGTDLIVFVTLRATTPVRIALR